MKQDFLKELRKQAEINNLDADSLVSKYEKRFDLAIEAGFSEEEAIAKFGSPEKIVSDLTPKKEDKLEENVETNVDFDSIRNKKESLIKKEFFNVYVEDKNVTVKIVSTDEEKDFSYKASNGLENVYYFDVTEEGFEFAPYDYSRRKNKVQGEVTIYVNKKYRFEDVDMEFIAGKLDATQFTIFADSFELNNVSGAILFGNVVSERVDIDNINGHSLFGLVNSKKVNVENISGNSRYKSLIANKLDLSTISGDVSCDTIVADEADLSTISGNVRLKGTVKKYTTSSVSGEIEINSQIISEDVINKTAKMLSDFTNAAFVDLSFIPETLKPTLDKIVEEAKSVKPKIKSVIDDLKNKK